MFIIFASAFLSMVPPASSGDVQCVLEQLTAAERRQIAEESLAGAGKSPAITKLHGALDDCAVRLGWTSEQDTEASTYANALIILAFASENLAQAGIMSDDIDRWFARQDEKRRTNTEIDPAWADELLTELGNKGIPGTALDANGETVGFYLGALIMVERTRLGMPL